MNIRDYEIIIASGLFDEVYYLTQTSVEKISDNALEHYLLEGWLDGLDPSAEFSTNEYLASHPYLISSNVNPLVHYVKYSLLKKTKKTLSEEVFALVLASNMFDEEYYLVSLAGEYVSNPLEHYFEEGAARGIFPSKQIKSYVELYSDLANQDVNPLLHYVLYGQAESRIYEIDEDIVELLNSSYYFDPIFYVKQLEGKQIDDPVTHYLTMGVLMGLDPSAHFSTTDYLMMNGDVKASGINPLVHYLLFGKDEGRMPKNKYIWSGQPATWQYQHWSRQFDEISANDLRMLTIAIAQIPHRPLISIVVPVYKPKLQYLEKAIESVLEQVYENWELVLVDDASDDSVLQNMISEYSERDHRIKFLQREENGHISECTNSGLAVTTGEFVCFLDQDDELRPHALALVASSIVQNPGCKLLYSDEATINPSGELICPYFKGDWNLYLLRSHNFVCHLAIYSQELLKALGGLRSEYIGAQDHDLALRASEALDLEEIIHIPHVLYYWRAHESSTASDVDAKPYAIEAGSKAIADHLKRCDVNGVVQVNRLNTYNVQYDLPVDPPSVAIIIPTKDQAKILRRCISSIRRKTDYPNYHIFIVDNRTTELEAIEYISEIGSDEVVTVLRYNAEFNYSAINNFAFSKTNHDFVLLLNNDTEVINPNWLSEMVALNSQPDVGIVGARLLYPNGLIQHAGLVMGIGGVAGHAHKFYPGDCPGYFGKTEIIHEMSGGTGACLLTRSEIFEQLCGLNEKELAVAFNDVDYCLRVRQLGYKCLFAPQAELYHHESFSRGADVGEKKVARLLKEAKYLKETFRKELCQDPYYNPNLSVHREDLSFAEYPRSPWQAVMMYLACQWSNDSKNIQKALREAYMDRLKHKDMDVYLDYCLSLSERLNTELSKDPVKRKELIKEWFFLNCVLRYVGEPNLKTSLQ